MSVFVDSTTLLYPVDTRHPDKGSICKAWLKTLMREDALTMSVQVLNESYWAAYRKPNFADVRGKLKAYLADYFPWCGAPLDPEVLQESWVISGRYGVHFWDALLLASANAAGCRWFLSEDLNDGQLYGGVTAVNPFRHAPQDVLGPRATS